MSESDMETLAQRLERLERAHHRLRLGSAVLVGLAAFVLMGQACKGRIIEAEAFFLNDTDGKLRASLGLVDGSPHLSLFGKAGKSSIVLSVDPNDIPALRLFDNNGQRRVELSAPAGKALAGNPGRYGYPGDLVVPPGSREPEPDGSLLVLYDRDGRHRAMLAVMTTGEPRLLLRDEKGVARSYLGLTPDGGTALRFHDDLGAANISIVGGEEPLMQLRDPRWGDEMDLNGTITMQLGFGGFPFVGGYDRYGRVVFLHRP